MSREVYGLGRQALSFVQELGAYKMLAGIV